MDIQKLLATITDVLTKQREALQALAADQLDKNQRKTLALLTKLLNKPDTLALMVQTLAQAFPHDENDTIWSLVDGLIANNELMVKLVEANTRPNATEEFGKLLEGFISDFKYGKQWLLNLLNLPLEEQPLTQYVNETHYVEDTQTFDRIVQERQRVGDKDEILLLHRVFYDPLKKLKEFNPPSEELLLRLFYLQMFFKNAEDQRVYIKDIFEQAIIHKYIYDKGISIDEFANLHLTEEELNKIYRDYSAPLQAKLKHFFLEENPHDNIFKRAKIATLLQATVTELAHKGEELQKLQDESNKRRGRIIGGIAEKLTQNINSFFGDYRQPKTQEEYHKFGIELLAAIDQQLRLRELGEPKFLKQDRSWASELARVLKNALLLTISLTCYNFYRLAHGKTFFVSTDSNEKLQNFKLKVQKMSAETQKTQSEEELQLIPKTTRKLSIKSG